MCVVVVEVTGWVDEVRVMMASVPSEHTYKRTHTPNSDLPDAEIKPPENVLFVCKLNPITTDEDLEIIFSRFGNAKAEIVRDPTTGDSLNYAFVEFDDVRAYGVEWGGGGLGWCFAAFAD